MDKADVLEICSSEVNVSEDFENTKLETFNELGPVVKRNTSRNDDKTEYTQDVEKKNSQKNVGDFNEDRIKAVLKDSDLETKTELSKKVKQGILGQAEDSDIAPSKDMTQKLINMSKVFVGKITTENDIEEFNPINVKTHKVIPIVDTTDSESEDVALHNKSFNFDIIEANTIAKSKTLVAERSIQKSRLAMLCDSDSDEDQGNASPDALSDNEIIGQSHAKNIKANAKIPWLSKKIAESSTKKPKTKNAETEIAKKMTSKQAAELRQEIQSESQRMMRERNISLPYHKPKAHSLKEFLARRPKFAVAVATGGTAPPSVAIKMSNEQLEIISKKLKEREEEVKQFYKSESESENDDDLDYVPSTSDINQSNKETIEDHKISHDQDNDIAKGDENNINTNAETADEDKSQDKQCEIESVVSKHDDWLKTVNLQNDFNGCRDIPDVEENVTTSKTSPKDEPIEIRDISRADENKKNMDDHEKGGELCQTANHNFSCQISTEMYEFHLDDENTEQVSSDNTLDGQQASNLKDNIETSRPECEPPLASSFFTNLDMEIENFGNSENHNMAEASSIDNPFSHPVKSKLCILKEKLANIKPRLSGGPDKVIDLDSTLVKPKEVVELMERFTKHMTTKKSSSKHKVKLSIVTVESGGDIHKETVAINVGNDDKTEVLEEKPGAKLHRLREELQKQMDQKKSEIWQQKTVKSMKGSGETYEDGDHSEQDSFYGDDEEEAEMTEEEDSEEELENYIELSDKPLKRCGFLDQEAEESGEEETLHKKDYKECALNDEDKMENSEDEESEDSKEDEDLIMATEKTPSEPTEAEYKSSVGRKKVLKRILKPDDDSDEEDMFPSSIPQKTIEPEQLDSTVTADEDDIPPHQTRQLQTPIREAVSQTKSISDFLTPISFITSIQNLASATKSYKNGPAISPFRMPRDQPPYTEERSAVSQKQLFTDSEVSDSQVSLDLQVTQVSILDIGQDNEITSLQHTQIENSDEPPCTQDLMGICSGEFTGVTQLEPADETTKLMEFDGSQSSELKCLGTDQDMIISQLLDEEELENFKKKFESPINSVTQHSINSEVREIIGGGIIESDDEDIEECGRRKKNNQRRIQFSDESSDDEKDGSDEEIDLQDNDKIDDEEIDNIGYDSEENEIDFNEIGKKEKMKLTDFLDAEAELSESDWGSEDEDEKDMDKLEFELGDTEQFDQEQVKADLEKIHLRRMLDDDAREVKLLQEVLLEDGEMHGTGRQRQFKWKNIDLTDDQTEEKKDDDEIYLDEEESEEQWRRKRHEREMFLKEKQHTNQNLFEDNDLVHHSQLLKIGQKVLQRSHSQNISQNNFPSEKTNGISGSPISNIPCRLLSKRGSFLSRSDQVLQRVTEYTKTTEDVSGNSTKTTKNFVFQSISTSEDIITTSENKKRKAADGTPNVIKKLRLNTNLSPAVKKTERSKRLFNF